MWQPIPCFSVTDVSEPHAICSTYFDSYSIIDMMNPMGKFEPDFFIPIDSLHIVLSRELFFLLMKTSWKP